MGLERKYFDPLEERRRNRLLLFENVSDEGFLLFAVVNCGDPGSPENGLVVGNTFTFLSEIQVACSKGYEVVGSEHRTCLANGQWSGVEASCDRKF